MLNTAYLDFYTGENRRKIFTLFHRFLDILRTEQYDELKTLLCDDCIADISMTGQHQGKENVINALKWPGPHMDLKRITFSNFVCRSHSNSACQSAYTQHLYALYDQSVIYPFTFGGEFCNSYRLIDGVWKLSHIRFDLMFEDGNNILVRNHWKLIDYGILFGHTPMINAELESPWISIPEDDEPQSDAEMIFELEYKNNVGMDSGIPSLSHSVFTDDVFLNYSSHHNVNKNYSHAADGDYYGRKDAINFFRSKQHKEARLQHVTQMTDLFIHGDNATAVMTRSEYNRIKNHIWNSNNIHQQPLTAIHVIDAVREHGSWKMKKMRYYPIMEFVEMKDDDLLYDGYINQDKTWEKIIKKYNIVV